MAVNFHSSIYNDKERVMNSKNDNIEMKINDEEDEISKSFQNRYQNNLEKLMKSSKFVFNYVHLLYYKCYKINLNCGYIYRFY